MTATLMLPTASVSFASGAPMAVKELRVIQAEYHHERVQVTVDLSSPSSKRYQTGTPVRVDWGIPPKHMQTFVGYVNHATPEHRPVEDRSDGGGKLRVVLVAPSWVLKDGDYQTFRNVSAATAVRQVAESFRLGTRNIHQHPTRHAVLHQQGRSFWEFMVECAQRMGWTLYARGMELHCLDRKQSALLTRFPPVLRSPVLGGSVREFRPKVGANAPGGGSLLVREGYGVNPRSGAVLYSRDDGGTEKALFNTPGLAPAFRRGSADSSFSDLGEGYDTLQSKSKANQLAVEATFTATVHPNVRVGGTVVMEGFGDGSDGGWYVTAVEHILRAAGRSEMRVTVGRDTARSDTFLVPQLLAESAAPRGARLVNQRWVLA
jgi:hypothetical protein